MSWWCNTDAAIELYHMFTVPTANQIDACSTHTATFICNTSTWYSNRYVVKRFLLEALFSCNMHYIDYFLEKITNFCCCLKLQTVKRSKLVESELDYHTSHSQNCANFYHLNILYITLSDHTWTLSCASNEWYWLALSSAKLHVLIACE
jgi:hypothetical protein